MQFSIQRQIKNKNALANITIFTALTSIGCILFSYLLLPVASAFYAALLMYENQKKRFFSYVIPIVVFLFNFLLNGIFSFDGIACFIIGTFIFVLCKKGISKGESAFWISMLMVASFTVSAILIGVPFIAPDGSSGVVAFYDFLIETAKAEFSEFLASLVLVEENGYSVFAYNPIEAEQLFNGLIIFIVPVMILTAIVLSGVSLKIFSSLISRYSGEDCGISIWRFSTTNFVAYFYLAIAIIAMLSRSDGSIFSQIIISLDIIFAPVFAYIGATVVHAVVVSRGRSSAFAIFIIVIACLVLYTFAVTLLSFIGVYFNVISNKISKKSI